MTIEKILHRKFENDPTYIYGFADLDKLIDKKFEGFRYAISIGKKLDDHIIDGICEGPTLEYYAYYNQINDELARTSTEIQIELSKIHVDSIVIEPTVSTDTDRFKDYDKTLTVDISHKMVATRAGLGWIGKSDLLISTRYGSRLRLTSILLNKKPDSIPAPIESSRCGKCRICVDRCPAQAANGELWNIDKHRDEFFDAQKCRQKCKQLAKQLLNLDKRICGICISVCPIGRSETASFHIPEA